MVTLYGCTQMSSSKTIIVNNDTNKWQQIKHKGRLEYSHIQMVHI
jgi:hypothetical protein